MTLKPGRPRVASKEMLQDAAFELFQLRGYRNTTVELIAKTAGFSRATFFNFFDSKAELFWVETDELLVDLRRRLDEHLSAQPHYELSEVLVDYADTLDSAAIPWALQNYRLLEAADDLIASGASRVLGITESFQYYLLKQRSDVSGGSGDSLLSTEAAIYTAVLLTSLLGWIDAGVDRGSFRSFLEPALSGRFRPVETP